MAQQSNFLNTNYRHIKTVNPTSLNSNAFYTNTSESIVGFVVEKVISLAMTDLLQRSIISAIPSFCFEDVQRAIDPYIQISFIPCDHDDLDIPLLKEDINDDAKKPEIFNSNIEQIDKLEDNHSQNSHHSLLRPSANAIFFDNYFEGTNTWDTPVQPRNVAIDRDASTVIPQERMAPDQERKEEGNQSISSQKKERREYASGGGRNKKEKSESQQKKKKGQPPLEIVSHDLPKELIYNVNETEELAQMRLDREKELIQREIENRKRKKKAEENLEKMNEVVKKQKEFEYKNITVDSNGAIVFIREVQPELFPVEFRGLSSTTKEIQLIKAEPIKLPIVPPPKPRRQSGAFLQSPEKNKEAPKEKAVMQKKSIVSRINPVVNAFATEKQADLKEEKLYREKYCIQPSGSVFDSIKLEVGVALLEETKYKTGGKDFFKKYKKYSVENFQLTQSKAGSDYDASFNKEKKSETRQREQDEKSKHVETEVNYVNINTEPGSTVKVLNVKTKNLRNAFDKLDLITEEQEKAAMKRRFNRTRPGDMFNKGKATQLDDLRSSNSNSNANKFNNTQTSFNEMNQFAQTILSNQAWGTNPLKFKAATQAPKIPMKPQLNDIMKEMPGGILNTKMPRARRFAHANKDNRNMTMNNTTTTGFFKVVHNAKYKPELTQTGPFKPKVDLFGGTNNNSSKPFNKTATDNLFKG